MFKILTNKFRHGLVCIFTICACSQSYALDVSGFVRLEGAYRTTGEENPFNQTGNTFNGVPLLNQTLGINVERPDDFSESTDWNMLNARLEVDLQHQFSGDLAFYMKVRAYGEGTHLVEDVYDGVDSFGKDYYGGDRANTFEHTSKEWYVDLATAYFDWNKGNWWARIGNQQIAWGEAIFFRVLDIPNGLDLRRHLFQDVAGEEYADERVPAPGVRLSYTFNNSWELEGYVQKFAPTIFPNAGTPYNVIPSQFVVDEKAGWDASDADNAWNMGIRVTAPVTDSLTLMAIASSRVNPEGAFRWSEAQGPSAVAGTPFEVNPGGVYSTEEWFAYNSLARFDGVQLVASAYQDFPAAEGIRQAFGLPVPVDYATAQVNLDAFFGGVAPLKGWITREFHREQVYGLGANYIVTAEPGSFWDQLVIRGEVSYANGRKFSDVSLGKDFHETDETAASIIFEKYHRWTDKFPATFMVLEWLYKSDSDLFGRNLQGFNNPGGIPKGESSYNAFVFAAQQPFPNLIWRADLAVLVEQNGGYLIQPGLRYKPAGEWQIDLYANIFNGDDDDALGTLDFADEFFFRFSYFF